MTNKTMAIVSYITIIGWIIAYMEYKKSADRSPLVNYHLGQALGLFITSVVLSVAMTIVIMIIPTLGLLYSAVSVLYLVLLLMGIIAASNEAMKPVPVVGRLFEGKFNFAA